MGELSPEYFRPVILTAACEALELNHVEAGLSKPKRLPDSCVAHDNEWQEPNEGAVRVLGSWRDVFTCRTSVLIRSSAVRSYSQMSPTRYSRLDCGGIIYRYLDYSGDGSYRSLFRWPSALKWIDGGFFGLRPSQYKSSIAVFLGLRRTS